MGGAVPAVMIDGFVKEYRKGKRAVDGLSLRVEQGTIFGLIGPNGAGKSTTIRTICTLLKPTAGTVEVLGHNVVGEPMEVRRSIAYLPEDAGAYERLTGREYLEFMSSFYPGDREAAVAFGTQIAALGGRIDSKIAEYSNGMKRRLLIARTLMTRPRLAVMDEPTSGLDVINGHHVRRMIRDTVRTDGSTAIVSSHNMLEIEFLCDRVAFIDRGRILGEGTPGELKESYGRANLEEVFLEMEAHG